MRSRGIVAFVLLFCLIIAVGGSAWAATITGRVLLPDGRPLMERFVYANAEAPNTDHKYAYIGTGDNGYYTLSGVSTGTWAVGVVDPWFVRAEIRHVDVTNASGTYTVNFNLQSTYYSPADTWPGWRWVCGEWLPTCGSDYAQSFVATGPYVIRAAIVNAGDSIPIVVSIRSGGPTGTQIGPSRTVTSGKLSHGEVSWSADEVTLTPGQTYYLRARSQDGSNWAPGLGAVPYANGQLYINGTAQPGFDMTWSLSSDDDGYVSSYYFHRYKFTSQYGTAASEWGQTFIARSTDIEMATGHSASTAGDYDFSIHQFNTGTQTVGAQIGPTKTAYLEQEVGRDQTGGALWSPGEVPVTPGQTYYLRIVRHGGGTFQAYRFADRYAGGHSWHDGVAESGWDLESQILGAAAPVTETVTSPTLPIGWNLISLPQEPADGDPAVVFSGISINNRLYRYVTGVGYQVYTTANPAGFGGDVKRGEGYWLHLGTPATVSYQANPQSGTQAVAMPTVGWMLIGQPQNATTGLGVCQVRVGPSGTPISLAQADANHWLEVPFYWYQPTTGTYTMTGFDPWQESNLIAWRGYWVRVNQSNLEMLVP